MIELIIIISLLLVIATYVKLSIVEKSFFNILSPALLVFIPANYIFELFNIYFNGYHGSLFAYLFCYTTYALMFIAFAYAYIKFPPYILKLPFGSRNYGSVYLPYTVLILSFILFVPILIEYREFLLSPREIYMRTRTGHGLSFFLSSALTNLAFILFLFKKRPFTGERYIAFTVCTILALLHGSKGQVVTLVLTAGLYLTYVLFLRVKFRLFLVYTGAFSVILLSLFALNFQGFSSVNIFDINELVVAISSYSDSTRNAMMVIDSNMMPQFGRLAFEDAVYSRVPRLLFSNKPKNFGEFYLAEQFFPEWFDSDTGSPTFGIGFEYADFGILSIFYIVACSVLSGLLLKVFVTRLRIYKNPSDFILVLFFSGITLIPTGSGYLLPEHLFLALATSFMVRPKTFGKKPILSKQPSLVP